MLQAVIYSIRNLYNDSVLYGKKVYPEALNRDISIPKLKYTYSWKLEHKEHFNKFHKILLQFNQCKTEHESQIKKTLKIQNLLEEKGKSRTIDKFAKSSILKTKKAKTEDAPKLEEPPVG